MKKSLKKKQNGIIVIMLAVLALFGVLFSRARVLAAEKAVLEEHLKVLEARLEEEQERKEELEEKQDYMSTINYIEDVAREKLGLVYSDEVIFKEKDDDSE